MPTSLSPFAVEGRLNPRRCSWAALAVCAGLFGCGGGSDAPTSVKVYEVKGSVVLADGKPLGGGTIHLVPKQGLVSPEGKIGSDGTFKVATSGSGEGAPAGEYSVRIEPTDPTLLAGKKKTAAGKKLPFPEKYLDEDTSKLTVTVKPEPNTLQPLELK